MNYLTLPIVVFFLLTVLLALYFLGRAVGGSKIAIALLILWMCAQSAVALAGFYLVTDTAPPRFFLAAVPPILVIAGLFLTQAGRRFLDAMELKWCVILHSIRIFVEINLYWLFLKKQVPALMTLEGGNIDLLAGLSAPLVWWAYSRGRLGRRGLLIWNSICLLTVMNAFIRAVLSAPFRFQRFAFDQPTVAVLHFPFILLPAFLVPAVLLCHAVLFRKLSQIPRG